MRLSTSGYRQINGEGETCINTSVGRDARGSKHAGRGLIPNRVDIDQRTSIFDDKVRFGDLEIDTIIGKNPKGTDLSDVTEKKIKWIENKLNNRPRKKIGYLTPNKKFKLIINQNSVAVVS
jgi:IS30 family transposase